jgi:hypothetical protein
MLVLLSLAVPGFAQSFLDPLPMPMGPSGTAILTDGTTVQGEPKCTPKGIGNIKKLQIELADGTKRKLAPGDVTEFRLIPGGLAKAMGAANAMSSISEMAKTNVGETIDRSEAVFVFGVMPNGKPALMQLLNPGFDATIQVFADPAGRETTQVSVGGIGVAGGAVKSYLVAKKGDPQTVLVKKGQYDQLWDSIYGDCSSMTRPEKPDFATMAADVSKHASSCGPAAAKAAPVAAAPEAEAPAETPPTE